MILVEMIRLRVDQGEHAHHLVPAYQGDGDSGASLQAAVGQKQPTLIVFDIADNCPLPVRDYPPGQPTGEHFANYFPNLMRRQSLADENLVGDSTGIIENHNAPIACIHAGHGQGQNVGQYAIQIQVRIQLTADVTKQPGFTHSLPLPISIHARFST